MIRQPPTSTPFPSTTLFRSLLHRENDVVLERLRAALHEQAVRRQPGRADPEASSAHDVLDRVRDRKSTRLNSQSRQYLVCRLLLEKKKRTTHTICVKQYTKV